MAVYDDEKYYDEYNKNDHVSVLCINNVKAKSIA